MAETTFQVEQLERVRIVRLQSSDGTNRLTRRCIAALTDVVSGLQEEKRPIVFTGNERFFSAGAELEEVAALDALRALDFSRLGQTLMYTISKYPAPVGAAISGYCMGGGLDLALACHYRIASRTAILGHRGAALGLITGWGGTQRLPRLVGKGPALQMFVAAEPVPANQALQMGLIDAISDDPVHEAIHLARI